MNEPEAQLRAWSLPGVPLVQAGDDIARLTLDALARLGLRLQAGDVLVVASKIISKAEGRRVALADVVPSAQAVEYASLTDKDPRMVELVLRESRSVSRAARGVLVVEHRLGFISANAGIDQSNIEDGEAHALLLPLNPDATAQSLRERLQAETGADCAVIISDTHGRPFRMGNIGVAIGVAGVTALLDLRGQPDLFGRELKITQQGYADLLASTAHLLCGEGGEGRPMTLLRGLDLPGRDGHASDLNRPPQHDLYR